MEKDRMNWIKRTNQEPPKDRRFLAKTNYGVEMMQWFEPVTGGFYQLYCGCSCCNGYCSVSFDEWMQLPE